MLCAEFSPELDAVETHEFGLCIVLQESGMNARTRMQEAKPRLTNKKREEPCEPDEKPYMLTDILNSRSCCCSRVIYSFQDLTDVVATLALGISVKIMPNPSCSIIVARNKTK